MVSVWVVKKAIAKGTSATDIRGSLEQKMIPKNLEAAGLISGVAQLKGLVANAALVPGEQVLASRFDTPTVARHGDVPKGLLQVTVKLDAERALGGRLQVGDKVAVLLSFPVDKPTPAETHLEFHKVLVTSVQISGDASTAPDTSPSGSKDAKKGAIESAPTQSVLVTLALPAPSVERVVYAAEFGTVWLSNEPANAPEDGTQIITPGNVYGGKAAAR